MKAVQDPKSPWCALVTTRSGSAHEFRMVGTGKRSYLHIKGEDGGKAVIVYASGEATLRAIADMIHAALDGHKP